MIVGRATRIVVDGKSFDLSKVASITQHYIFRPPNRSRGRSMQPGQFIHESVLAHLKHDKNYRPSAERAGGTMSWDVIKTRNASAADLQGSLVRDLYSSAKDIISDLDKTLKRSVDAQIARRHTDPILRTTLQGHVRVEVLPG